MKKIRILLSELLSKVRKKKTFPNAGWENIQKEQIGDDPWEHTERPSSLPSFEDAIKERNIKQ